MNPAHPINPGPGWKLVPDDATFPAGPWSGTRDGVNWFEFKAFTARTVSQWKETIPALLAVRVPDEHCTPQ